jgi:hypothetical protein
MAKAEHLAKLKEGASAWNTWRREHHRSLPNLRKARLRAANLIDAELSTADFRGADLSNALLIDVNFHGANLNLANLHDAALNRANLRYANLRSANLCSAHLSNANLNNADLSLADLSKAILTNVDLNGTNLSGSDMSNTTIAEAAFGNNDLSLTRGLETVRHLAPSSVGIDTIYRSKGKIPDSFLRGCGVPDEFITYAKSLVANPIQFYSCFISYAFKDQAFADHLYADLQNKGVRCWFAPHDVQGGRKLHEQIDEAIRLHDKLLLILSPHSMESEWVKTEIAKARRREVRDQRRVLFPIRLAPFETLRDWECFDADTGKDSAREIREYFIPDFSNWKNHDSYQEAFQRLISDLKASDSKPK